MKNFGFPTVVTAAVAVVGASLSLVSPVLAQQSYRNEGELGKAQLLRGNQDLMSALKSLEQASQGEYITIQKILQSLAQKQGITVNSEITDFLGEKITTGSTDRNCQLGNFLCDEEDVTYEKYINAKLQLQSQSEIFSKAAIIYGQIQEYQNKLENDRLYGGQEVSQRISSKLQDFHNIYLANQKPSLSFKSPQDTLESLGKIGGAIPTLEEYRIGYSDLLFNASFSGLKLASAFIEMKVIGAAIVKKLNLQQLGINPDLDPSAVAEFLREITLELPPKVQEALLKLDTDKMRDINLELAAKLIDWIDTDDSRLVRSAALVKIRANAVNIQNRIKVLQQPEVSKLLDDSDKLYLDFKQFSDVLDAVNSLISLILGSKEEAKKLTKTIDAVRSAVTEAASFTYRDEMRRKYKTLKAQYIRNHKIISGLDSFYEGAFTDVGQYLVSARKDVIFKQGNGWIIVNTNRLLNPPGLADIDLAWEKVNLMQNQLTAITNGGSSHIGSAAYFIGRSPVVDKVRDEQFNGARIPNLQEKSQYTDGVILQPPVDIVLTWNQNTKLDLDSHLTGPASADENSPVRFHVYWDARGSLNGTPNALLYRDTIPDPDIGLTRPEQARTGPEQTRINTPLRLQPGVYRFYVNNFSSLQNGTGTPTGNAAGPTGLSNSGAAVQVYQAGTAVPNFDPNNPSVQGVGKPFGDPISVPIGQQGNVWQVFELDSRTGILRRVNQPFGNVSDPALVPSVNPAESR
jgi:hypothetical protein